MFVVIQITVRGGYRDPYKYRTELFVLDNSTSLCFPLFHCTCIFISSLVPIVDPTTLGAFSLMDQY